MRGERQEAIGRRKVKCERRETGGRRQEENGERQSAIRNAQASKAQMSMIP